jgi:hypothetical protein
VRRSAHGSRNLRVGCACGLWVGCGRETGATMELSERFCETDKKLKQLWADSANELGLTYSETSVRPSILLFGDGHAQAERHSFDPAGVAPENRRALILIDREIFGLNKPNNVASRFEADFPAAHTHRPRDLAFGCLRCLQQRDHCSIACNYSESTLPSGFVRTRWQVDSELLRCVQREFRPLETSHSPLRSLMPGGGRVRKLPHCWIH